MKIHKKQFQILQQVGTVSPLEVNLCHSPHNLSQIEHK